MTKLTKHSFSNWFTLIKRSFAAWSDDYAPSMGAALSYYTVFSMAPLLLLVISVAGLVFGQEAARGELFSTLTGLMGAEAAKTIQEMLAAMSKPAQGAPGTAISIGVLVVGATTVFGELQDALDRIWRAPDRAKKGGLWGLLRSRVLSFGMVLGIAFLLMVSLVSTAAVSALGKWWGGYFGEWEVVLQVVNVLVGFLITAVGFGLIYKFMPRVHVPWSDVVWGASVTSLLFTVGKFLIGLYIGKTGVASGFGAAGSVAVVFVWVYYSAQIFLLGAEFTWIYAQMFGSRSHLKLAEQAPVAPQRTGDAVADASLAVEHAAHESVPIVSVTKARTRQLDMEKVAQLVLSIAVAVAIQRLLPKLIVKLTIGRAQRGIAKSLNAHGERLRDDADLRARRG